MLKTFEYKNYTARNIMPKIVTITIYVLLMMACKYSYDAGVISLQIFVIGALITICQIIKNACRLISTLTTERNCLISFTEIGIEGQIPAGLFSRRQINISYEDITYFWCKNIAYPSSRNSKTTPKITLYTNSGNIEIRSVSRTLLQDVLEHCLTIPQMKAKLHTPL